MKLYYAPNSRAVRIAWLLEELGTAYEVEKLALGDKAMREPGYLSVHPVGRVPALVDGETTIFESGAIVQYLLERHGGERLRPGAGSPEFPAYLQWFHYCEGMIMPQVNVIVVETQFLPPERRSEEHVSRARKLLGRMLAVVDRHMEGRDYLAGDFTAADIMTGHSCVVSGRLGADLSGLPNVQAYTRRLEARPAFQRAGAL